MGTNVRLPKIDKILSAGGVFWCLPSLQQNRSLGTSPIDIAEPYYTHGNMVGGHSSDEYQKANEPSVCHKLLSI